MGEVGFRAAVIALVREIPPGRVMTYGDVAQWCGRPGAARAVGQVARLGNTDVPWQRVVRAGGDVAEAMAGWQVAALAAEGVTVTDRHIAGFDQLRWWPGAP